MAAKSAASNTTGWSKWQIAVALGTPVLLGVGIWYYKSSRKDARTPKIDKDNASSKDGAEDSNAAKSKRRLKPINVIPSTIKRNDASTTTNNDGSLEDKADAAKIQGNQYFKDEKYDDAIRCYTAAIALCPSDKVHNIATFYQNRAAAYEKQKKYQEVIIDCSRALDLNPKYTKALNRRAKAYENQLDLEKALQDATAMCILEQFQNQSSLVLADRVLKQLGQQRAKEAMKNRKLVLPSKHFVKSYFSSFAEDPILNFTAEQNGHAEDKPSPGFLKAHSAILSGNYDNIIDECSKDVADENSPYFTQALLLRGTFYFLWGQIEHAVKDMETLRQLNNVDVKILANGLIKLATMKVQNEKVEEAFEAFKAAEEIDPNNCDIFHHRAQVNLLLEKMEDAVQDFDKATQLNPDFPIAAVQKCYTDFRFAHFKHDSALLDKTMVDFKATVEKFPHCSEGYALYAQALVDQQKFEKADKYYKRAMAEDPSNANIYVHKGLLVLHWKQDFPEALNLIKTAIEKDDRCEFAYETLGALEVQRGDLNRALELFGKAIALARTEPELAHLYSLRDAAAAQQQVAKRLGIPINEFGSTF